MDRKLKLRVNRDIWVSGLSYMFVVGTMKLLCALVSLRNCYWKIEGLGIQKMKREWNLEYCWPFYVVSAGVHSFIPQWQKPCTIEITENDYTTG